MASGAGNLTATGKSTASESPPPPTSFSNSKKRKLNPKYPLLRRLSSAAAATNSFLQSTDLFLPPSQSLRLQSLLSSLPISPPSSTSTSTWFNRFLISAAEDGDPRWNLNFRISKPAFFNLLTILSTSDSHLAATLFRLAHNASYASLLLRFGFDSVPDASRAFFTVCKLINEKLGRINDPNPYFSPRLLPNCCGVLGFGRFELIGDLIGSKGALIVQALVDSNGRFADISAGWPSTMKPDAIFRQSKLYKESKTYFNGALCKLENGISVPCYILGDSYLPLMPWNLTPYKEEEDGFKLSHRDFNNVVHTALNRVEIAFDKVRARFRILDTKWEQERIEFLPFVITTCCLLHNFLLNCGYDEGGINGEMRTCEEEEEDEDEEMMRFEEGEEDLIESKRIRDAIAENLSRVSSV